MHYKIIKSVLMVFILIMGACQKWTPLAEGHFSVDGKRYDVHVLYLVRDEGQIAFQGNEVNVVMYLLTTPNLTPGTYNVSWGLPGKPNGIQVSVYGGPSVSFNSDIDSEGTMTVERSGANYAIEFTGTISGHHVEVHYKGLASSQ
jgi:hypothetical protein